jgi:two-component system, LytTR family, response regulator
MSLRTVLVDDEPLARERLRLLLREEPDIEVVAECRNGNEAIAYLEEHEVDLLLLDVQMPDLNGLEVVEEVGLLHLPATVFVTAFEQHAVSAFDLQAVDYLTKPVQLQRLKRALVRVRDRVAAKQALLTQSQFSAIIEELRRNDNKGVAYPKRLLVRDGVKEILVDVDSIVWIEACDYYSGLHVGKQTLLIRQSISVLSQELNPAAFLRIHRSTIVNLKFVQEIYREGPKQGTVVLKDGQQLQMSKLGRQNLSKAASVAAFAGR